MKENKFTFFQIQLNNKYYECKILKPTIFHIYCNSFSYQKKELDINLASEFLLFLYQFYKINIKNNINKYYYTFYEYRVILRNETNDSILFFSFYNKKLIFWIHAKDEFGLEFFYNLFSIKL